MSRPQATWASHPSPHASLGDFGAVGDGVADDSVAIRRWATVAAGLAASDGFVNMYVPPGVYKTTLAGRIFPTGAWGTSGVVAVIPSNARVYGERGQSVFLQTGVPATASGVEADKQYQLLGVADGSSNIVFEDLTFRGENDPYTYHLNNQASAIDMLLSTTHDVTVRRCHFDKLYGFSVHDRGANDRINVVDCLFTECANGLNVNANHSMQTGNRFWYSEGIEAGGSHLTVANNQFFEAQGVAISIGGNQTPGVTKPGTVVLGNTIDYVAGGSGIVIADAVVGATVAGNTISHCDHVGIVMSYGAGAMPSGITFTGNTVYDNCLADGAYVVGVDLNGADHTFIGNSVFVTGAPGWQQSVAVNVRGAGCLIEGNYLDGAVGDGVVTPTATDTHFGNNRLANGRVTWTAGGTSSRAAEQVWAKATTDRIIDHRVTGGSVGAGFSRFSMFADGRLEWGSASTPRDTNLYRSAADLLKTDDSFQVGGDLRVSTKTPASATATGVAGTIAWDASHIYVCTATDTWKRAAIAAW